MIHVEKFIYCSDKQINPTHSHNLILLSTNANREIQFTNRNQTLSHFCFLKNKRLKRAFTVISFQISTQISEDQRMKLLINQIFFYRKSSKPNTKTHANDFENVNSDLSCQKMSFTTQLTKHFKTELSSSYSKKGGRPTLARFLLILIVICQKQGF